MEIEHSQGFKCIRAPSSTSVVKDQKVKKGEPLVQWAKAATLQARTCILKSEKTASKLINDAASAQGQNAVIRVTSGLLEPLQAPNS